MEYNLFEKIVELNRRQGMTIVLVEQNARAALAISHHAGSASGKRRSKVKVCCCQQFCQQHPL